MEIAHIVWSFRTGGIENMLLDIMTCQARDGHDVSLIVINDDYDPELLRQIPPEVHAILMRRRSGTRAPWFALRLNMLARSFSVIHCHQSNLLPLFLPCYRHKIVLTIHSFQSRLGVISSKCRVAAISSGVAEHLKSLGCASDITVIPNGLPCSRIPYSIPAGFDNTPSQTFRIVQVGRLLHQSKGQDLLIMALAQLRALGVTNVLVDFIGDGESEPGLHHLAKSAGVQHQVFFLGNRSRKYIYEHLRDYHLMVHPARSEGFGLAVAEAMLAGLPVLVPDSGPLDTLVRHGHYGTIFRYGDHLDCARMISVVMQQYAKAAHKTVAACQHIIDRYSIRQQVSAYYRLYAR